MKPVIETWNLKVIYEVTTCEESPNPGVIVNHIGTTPSHCCWAKHSGKSSCPGQVRIWLFFNLFSFQSKLSQLIHESILMFAVINLERCISRKVKSVFIGFRFYFCWIWEWSQPDEGGDGFLEMFNLPAETIGTFLWWFVHRYIRYIQLSTCKCNLCIFSYSL